MLQVHGFLIAQSILHMGISTSRASTDRLIPWRRKRETIRIFKLNLFQGSQGTAASTSVHLTSHDPSSSETDLDPEHPSGWVFAPETDPEKPLIPGDQR